MYIRLNGSDECIIYINLEPEKACSITQQAYWIITHISSHNPTMLLFDLKKVIPLLKLYDVNRILDVYDKNTDSAEVFISICNILANETIAHVTPCDSITI